MDIATKSSLSYTLLERCRIPPLKANEGHRANEWGDLAQPLWKGRLRILEKSKGAALQFEDGQTGLSMTQVALLLRVCSILRVTLSYEWKTQERRHTSGWVSLSDRIALTSDYTKRFKASLNPEPSSEDPPPYVASGPKKDYTLKEGQTFSISIPGRNKAPTGSNIIGSGSASSVQSGGGGIPLLPPPPSAPRK
ncbi:hypothetical protein DXG03_000858, partial [Asterophora parasitica]